MNKHFKALLTSIDVLNTIHGGTTEPRLSVKEGPASREIRIRVPGIDKEALTIEVNNHNLEVYCVFPVLASGNRLEIPRVIYNQPIPYFIEVGAITANFDEMDLVVDMPFNELSNGYSKKIKIG